MNLTFAAKRALMASFAFLGVVAAPDAARAADIRGVTFSPGEWSKTVPGVVVSGGADALRIYATAWPMICYVPTDIEVKSRFEQLARLYGRRLEQLLGSIERTDRNTLAGVRSAIAIISPRITPPVIIDASTELLFQASFRETDDKWKVGQALQLTPDSPVGAIDCLGLSDAQVFVEQIRQIIRLHLGMPVAPAPARGIEPPRRP